MARDDKGQVVPLVLVVLLVAAGAAVLVVRLGNRAADQARAQTAADAAALAGAADGRAAAARLTEANGAVLVSFVEDADGVRVGVRIRDAHAVARARRTDLAETTAYSGADAFGPTRRDDPAGGSPRCRAACGTRR